MKTKMKTKSKAKPKEKRMKYDAENLKKALNAVKCGMSKKQAAKEFQVPRSTIQFRLNNPDKINLRPGPSTVLTDAEENVLVNWILQSSKKGFPRRKEDIQCSVSEFLKKSNRPNPFKNNLPGDKWLKLFLNRHPEIAVRTPESVTAASSVVSENDIRGWFTGIENYLKDNELFDILSDPSRVLNGDETNFLLCPKTGVVLALKGDKNVYEIDRGQAKSAITVMFTFCANGELTPPMVILPYKRLPGEIASKVPEEWGIGLSDNGWMKADLFYEYIRNVLHPYLVKQGKLFPVILFVDGHKTHLTLQVSELCSNLKIILIALYPNCTRILQPADVAAFFPLKCAWKQSVLRWRREHPAQALTKAEFVPILKSAMEVSLKPDTIKNGFRACGLQPWNADALDYTKCLGDSQRKDSQVQSENDVNNRLMTKTDFIKVVGSENIEVLKGKDLGTIENASKLLQNLWYFFCPNETENIEAPAIPMDQEQLDTRLDNNMIILDNNLNESNDEISFITISHEVEIENTSEANLLPLQCRILSPPNNNNNYDSIVPSELPRSKIDNIQDIELTADIIPTSTPKTPLKLNLTPVNLNDILVLPKTPKRKGTKNSEKTPFVLTSEEWQRINIEKKKAKELKEEGIKKRKLEREQKKILTQINKKQNSDKGKGKGKRGNAQDLKKSLLNKQFYLPDPVNIQEAEKENVYEDVEKTVELESNEEETVYETYEVDDVVPSTSSGVVRKAFTATEIFKMLTDSDDDEM